MSARQERIARKARQRAGIEHYYKAPKVGTPRAERTTQPMRGHFNIRAFGFGPLAHRFLAQHEALGYNLPESLQQSERGQASEQALNTLESALAGAQEAVSYLEDIE